MEPKESHLLQNAVIKLSNSTKYLTPPKSGCKIIPQDDIGSVEEEPELGKNKMDEAEVYGASYIGCHNGCVTCKGKITPLSKIGACSKCKMSQRLDKCGQQLSEKLLVSAGGTSCISVAFLPMIRLITKDNTLMDLTDRDKITTTLMMSDPFMLNYTLKDIILAVYRKTQ